MKNIIILAIIFIICSVLHSLYNKNGNKVNIVFMSINHTSILKGVAIILVLMDHIGKQYNLSITRPSGAIGVCLFLIASGFGLNESFKKNGRKQYIRKRLIRVMVPYWIVLITLTIFYLINATFSLNIFAQNIFLIKLPDSAYWYLRIIIFWYIAYFLISFTHKKVKIFLLILATVIFSMITLQNRLYVWQIFSFPLGVIISDNLEIIKRLFMKKNFFIACASLILMIFMIFVKKMPVVNNNTYGFYDTVSQIILVLSTAIFIIAITFKYECNGIFNLTNIIGKKLSYEIYLTHLYFLNIIINNSFKYLIKFIAITIVSALFLKIINDIIIKSIEAKINAS